MKVQDSHPVIDLSVIIPTYNAKAHAHATARTLTRRLAEAGLNAEVLLVDDGSRVAERPSAGELPPGASVVQIDTNRGKGHAVRAGLLAASGLRRIFTDVDLPYGTDALLECYAALGEADFVYGDRSLPESKVLSQLQKRRKLSSLGFRLAVQSITGLEQADTQCGLKGLRGEIADEILPLLKTDRFAFDVEIFQCARDRRLTTRPIPVQLLNGHGSTVRLFRDSIVMLRDLLAIRARSLRGQYRTAKVEAAPGLQRPEVSKA